MNPTKTQGHFDGGFSKTRDSAPKQPAGPEPKREDRAELGAVGLLNVAMGSQQPPGSTMGHPGNACDGKPGPQDASFKFFCGLGSHLALACCCGPRHLKSFETPLGMFSGWEKTSSDLSIPRR